MNGRRAIVVGAAGQDGKILVSQLLAQGVKTLALTRDTINLLEARAVEQAIADYLPDELYYLAAYHHSAEQKQGEFPQLMQLSWDVHVAGLIHVLEAIRSRAPRCRTFYAASSLVFGHPATSPQDEATPLAPQCAYGMTKAAGVHCCRRYRNEGMHVSAGYLYNHESIYRSARFLSAKLVRAARAAAAGDDKGLTVGSLSAVTDWGYAPDYTRAMTGIVRHDTPDDYVIATGIPHSVADFARHAFAAVGLDWRQHIREDPAMLARQRPPVPLVGNADKLFKATGWRHSVSFEQMVRLLVHSPPVA